MIDRLAERGLVERARGEEDRRQVRVRLTASGCQILRQLSCIHREELRQSDRPWWRPSGAFWSKRHDSGQRG